MTEEICAIPLSVWVNLLICWSMVKGQMISEIQLGDHVAFFYRTKAEQLKTVIPFIAIGLERNERCMYIAEDHTPAEICRHLQDFGVDVKEAQKTNALSVVTKHETYLRHGAFQPHKMIGDLCDAVQSALDAGFTGLRAAGELSWALDLPSALIQMVNYEEELENHFHSKFAALCQYDESRFPAYLIERMKSVHPMNFSDGKLVRHSSSRQMASSAN
jgi:MEDS: MEthanogen/methylotroph, DcmR Sensory domain